MSHLKSLSSFFVAAALAVPAMVAPAHGQTLFEGARLITGDGGVIEDSAFVVTGNQISQVGRKGGVPLPSGGTRVDLTGKTVMPALIDAHVHMGYRKGVDFSQTNYTRENLSDILDRFGYYGVAAILEAGTARSDLPYELRANPPPGRITIHENVVFLRKYFDARLFFLSPRRRSAERIEERGLQRPSSPRPSPPSDGGEGVSSVPAGPG